MITLRLNFSTVDSQRITLLLSVNKRLSHGRKIVKIQAK